MCVIAFVPRGVETPSEEKLKQMWTANPDGAGYAYTRGNKVVFHKGFMKFGDLMDALRAEKNLKNTNLAIHFRIGTSGENDKYTCHPFPVSNQFGELRKTEGTAAAVLFHNGIIAGGGIASPLASDTQDFVIGSYPMLKKYNRSKCRDYFIEKMVEGNRVLVMYGRNKFKMYGKWEKDGDVLVSNTHYQWSHQWDRYYEDYENQRLPKYPHYNFNRHITETAKALWDKIITNGFAYLTPEDFEDIKNSCERYSSEMLQADGYKLGVDEDTLCVWVEETPVEKEVAGIENY